jgi:hypothetical protein
MKATQKLDELGQMSAIFRQGRATQEGKLGPNREKVFHECTGY